MVSRRDKQNLKKANHASLLSVENSLISNSKKTMEVKDGLVKVRDTMDTLERKTPPKKFIAANGEQIGDLGEKKITFKPNEGIQRCIKCRSASVVKPLICASPRKEGDLNTC